MPSLLPALAAALVLLAPPVPADAASSADEPTHRLTIEYKETSGAFRQARLALAPLSDGVDPLWRGPLRTVSVLTTAGQWILIDSFLSSGHSSGHHAEAEAMLPAPETVSVILLRPERGPVVGWAVRENEGYTKVEWTLYDQAGEAQQTGTACELGACLGELQTPKDVELGQSSLSVVASGGGRGI